MRPSKTRILILIKGLGIGGAEKLISEGARHWDTESFSYSVAYALPWKGELVPDLESIGADVRMIGGEKGLGTVFMSNLRGLLSEINPDIVHAHLPSMGIAARLTSSIPVVYTEHNLAGSYRLPTRVANRLTYRRNKVVIAVSEAVADSVRPWFSGSLRVIPNGVSCHVNDSDAESARAELGISDSSTRLIAHVGNIRPGKGHELLIEAVSLIIARRPDVIVVSIGGEKHKGDLERVRALAKTAGVDQQLMFLGRRPDALRFVAAADVFVNPSSIEGLPVAVLEAMSLGTPVVATSVGGVPTIVQDEATGLLVGTGDAEKIAEGVERLLADRESAQRYANEAQNLIESEYGLGPMVHAVEGVYREVLDG